MSMLGSLKKKKGNLRGEYDRSKGAAGGIPELYDADEIREVEQYIEAAFGPVTEVFQEAYASDLRVNIAVIPPTEEQPCCRLVTIGLGAHPMNVPEAWRLYHLDRAELVITLPADWKVKSDEEEWYWPVRWLKNIARRTIQSGAWLSLGHTISVGEPGERPAPGTDYQGAVLMQAVTRNGIHPELFIGSGKCVNFYQLIPLYAGELEELARLELRGSALGVLEQIENYPVVSQKREMLRMAGNPAEEQSF